MTLPLLLGLDGVNKMSKSADNYISLTEVPEVQFGKIMSISDKLIPHYLELAADFTGAEIAKLTNELEGDPRSVKEEIAARVVKLYHGEAAVRQAREHFDRVFRRKEAPADIAQKQLGVDKMKLVDVLGGWPLVGSRTRARQLIEQGGVKIDGVKVEDVERILDLRQPVTIQVGKRNFLKVSQ